MEKNIFGSLSAIFGFMTLSIGIISKTFLPKIMCANYRANVRGDFSYDMYKFNTTPIIVVGVIEVLVGLIILFWIKDTKRFNSYGKRQNKPLSNRLVSAGIDIAKQGVTPNRPRVCSEE